MPSKTRAPTPFANFVKENYGAVRQELAGLSHAEVMRKLSADFSSKTKLSESWVLDAHCTYSQGLHDHRKPVLKYLSQLVLHEPAAAIVNIVYIFVFFVSFLYLLVVILD